MGGVHDGCGTGDSRKVLKPNEGQGLADSVMPQAHSGLMDVIQGQLTRMIPMHR
jgi:hypothetical protein